MEQQTIQADPNVVPSPATDGSIPPAETPTLESQATQIKELTERLKNTRQYGDEQKNRADGLAKTVDELNLQPSGPIPTVDDAAMANEIARLRAIELQHIKTNLRSTYNLSDEEVSALEGSNQFELNASAMQVTLQKVAAGTLGLAPSAQVVESNISTPPQTPPIAGVTSTPGASPTAANSQSSLSDTELAMAIMDKAAGRA